MLDTVTGRKGVVLHAEAWSKDGEWAFSLSGPAWVLAELKEASLRTEGCAVLVGGRGPADGPLDELWFVVVHPQRRGQTRIVPELPAHFPAVEPDNSDHVNFCRGGQHAWKLNADRCDCGAYTLAEWEAVLRARSRWPWQRNFWRNLWYRLTLGRD